MTIASYRTPTDSGSDDDAFRASITDTGNLAFVVNGQSIVSNEFDYSNILDGHLHSLALSWDAEIGHWEIHVDGDRVDDGNGLATGQTIRENGHFVVGHEQDSIDGGYATNNEFKGTLHDIRVWDSLRSTSEIQNNVHTKFEKWQSAGEPNLQLAVFKFWTSPIRSGYWQWR